MIHYIIALPIARCHLAATMAKRSDLVESMAIAAAAACLAHCIALPVLIAALIFAVPTTLLALAIGYRHHRRTLPLLAGLGGLVLLGIAVLVYERTPGEAPVTIAGSLLIVAAHLSNWRLRRHHA
jgi:uncharacterized membrane protein YjjP (DUF1212 family)